MSDTRPHPDSAKPKFEFREFREDCFRSMEVQICEQTETIQFACEDHGGDHPTVPAVAIDWAKARDLAAWILDRTGSVAQQAPD
jgi:hypothetical protein